MKKTIILLFILAFSINVNAQKKKTKAKPKPPKVVVVKAIEATEVYMDVDVMDVAVAEGQVTVDTLHIHAGKKYVFLVDVSMDNIGVQTFGGPQDTEEKELKSNFSEHNLEIIKLNNYTYVVFENGKTLEVDGIGNSYKAMAYWSGKIEDTIEVQESIKMATEFVSAQLGENKESSYLVITRNAREEVEKYKNANNFTEKSKQVMNAVLNLYSLPIQDVSEDEMFLLKKNNAKLKSCQSYFLVNNKKKTLHRNIIFDANGNPSNVKQYSNDGALEEESNFVYINGKLTNIIKSNEISMHYDDDKMILTKNVGEADETTIFHLENDILLGKYYVIFNDDTNISMNYLSEGTLEKNCEIRKINNDVWSRNCTSKPNEFPFINTYTSYQDGEVLQYRKTKISKKDDKTYEKYYSSAESVDERDVYKLGAIYSLNEKNLVHSIKYLGEENFEIVIDYTY